MTDLPSPTPREALVQTLQDQLATLPVPPGAGPPSVERLLAFLGERDAAAAPHPADGDGRGLDAALIHDALIDAALLSVIEAFDSPPAAGEPGPGER
jgi:hypothetical protein